MKLFPPYRNRYLPAFTLEEIANLPDKEKTPVILPIGAIEQHGTHMPVGVDSLMAQARLNDVMSLLPPTTSCLVAPPILIGKSNEHSGFPGTLIIDKNVLRKQILSVAESLSEFGFKYLLILNTHGGNIQVIRYTLREIEDMFNLSTAILKFEHGMESISKQEATYGFHAGEGETSWMLNVLDNKCIDLSIAQKEFPASIDDPGELRPECAPAIFSWVTSDLSFSGVMGDASVASREKGDQWMAAAAQSLATVLIDICESLN